ncbi:E3 ubiquitin-protein ligase TRIM39-like [Salarias fasciatus]|uniref:E3 ubiquitin-protein ligase TRIM39-like n=1 Tax=Salarias fasciatus TaxID=181472 RepID=A0A672HVL9_SALFA|nr:E3 ubiquitin-protein ligase TRIM39-like [Salarias fasciatus]
MTAASSCHSEDQFLCSICLDVFTDPVSTSCGHTFCQSCITLHWNTSNVFSCPVCKQVFKEKPELHVNRFIKEIVSQFRRETQQESSGGSSEQRAAGGGVLCDICTGTRVKALKSCLVCLTSYCETHLEPHRSRLALRRHQLIEPVEDLEGRMCPQHDKPLELFCQSDQTCVCMLCSVLEHKNHQFVPLREEADAKKAELGKVEAEIRQIIQEKRKKVKEIREAVRVNKESADEEKAEGVEVFRALVQAAEDGLKKLIKDIDEKHKAKETLANSLLGDLDQEICELIKKSSELEQLSRSDDHLHLLQSFPTLKAAALSIQDSVEDSVSVPLYNGMVVRAVTELEKTMRMRRKKLSESELRMVQKYAVEVTLDPETANYWLHLSDNKKQVHDESVWKELPENPKRFKYSLYVLGEQSFSSGRFYFEVQVRKKTEWDVGVVVESIDREETQKQTPKNGYFVFCLLNKNEYLVCTSPSLSLKLQSHPRRVGVFVDYDEGLVSFYDADTAALIYSFTGYSFTEKLFPFFSPGYKGGSSNSAPLVISSLNEIGEISELSDLFG